MIGSLRGTLLDRSTDGEVLVEVSGVGYRVVVSPTTAVQVGEVGAEVFLHIHHHMRDDHQALYGFRVRDERLCFEALLGAHGVGPALAMAILSVHPPAGLVRVLADDDIGGAVPRPRCGEEDRGPVAHRAEEPARGARARRPRPPRRRRRRGGGRAGRRATAAACAPMSARRS